MIVCKGLLFLSVAYIQLASDPSPEELLVQTLVELGELEQSYCARFTGTLSSIQNEVPKDLEILGIAAKNERGLLFHSYGTQTIDKADGAISPTLCWFDALRDSRSLKKRFKMGNAGQIARNHADLKFEEENVPNNPNAIWPWPEVDPFGMVFGSESRMQRRYSEFGYVRDELTRKFEFQGSRVLENRNTEGKWLSLPDKTVSLTIEFDRQRKNLPVVVKTEIVAKKLVTGQAKTTWVKYDKDFWVPETMSIASEREDGYTVQIDLKWEWVPLDKWSRWSAQNSDGLFNSEVNDFRTPFLELFANEKKSRGSKM